MKTCAIPYALSIALALGACAPERIPKPAPTPAPVPQVAVAQDLAQLVKQHAARAEAGRGDYDLYQLCITTPQDKKTELTFADAEPVGNAGREDRLIIRETYGVLFSDVGLDGFQSELGWDEYAIVPERALPATPAERRTPAAYSHDFRDKSAHGLDVPRVNSDYLARAQEAYRILSGRAAAHRTQHRN